MFTPDGKDTGYMDDPNWWFTDVKHRFRMTHPSEDYPSQYFPLAKPSNQAIEWYVQYVKQFFKMIAGKELTSVVEFGSGGGWFAKEFVWHELQYQGFEGSSSAREMLDQNGVGGYVDEYDLRIPLEVLGNEHKNYDIALFTEVAEHIPLPFHATVINNILQWSDMVWFSSEGPEVANQSHLHHCSEMPMDYWIKLFDWFGFKCFMLPDYVMTETENRGRAIFYNPKTYKV